MATITASTTATSAQITQLRAEAGPLINKRLSQNGHDPSSMTNQQKANALWRDLLIELHGLATKENASITANTTMQDADNEHKTFVQNFT